METYKCADYNWRIVAKSYTCKFTITVRETSNRDGNTQVHKRAVKFSIQRYLPDKYENYKTDQSMCI